MMGSITRDKQYKERWLAGNASFWQRTAMGALGVRIVDVDDEHIELAMLITDAARQPYGLLHGGISLLLAESAASAHSTWGVDMTKAVPVGIEINGTHLRSASEGEVRAVARVLRRSRSLIFHEVDILHAESGDLLCRARVTNFYKVLRGD